LIQTHLPADLVAAMDLDSHKLQKDTFIDEELRDRPEVALALTSG
jgi:predicted transposase YdaD